jgi:predicted RNase H-like nuclease
MITDNKKAEIKQQLREGEVVVEFTKVNGDYRKMTCTLQEGVVPEATKTDTLSQKKVREVSPEVCVVYDVNAKGWRSFRWDSVIDAKPDCPF